jgi:hypothetical protein
MPGVLFVVRIPTAEYEKRLMYGTSPVVPPSADMFSTHGLQTGPAGKITVCHFHEEVPLIYVIFLFYNLCICSLVYSLSLLDCKEVPLIYSIFLFLQFIHLQPGLHSKPVRLQ